ncbi:MAG: hypothetical protein IIC28_10735 [Chloroflexi bacterium]|nr:hypothetical protein [Chloroflexota bacterium]
MIGKKYLHNRGLMIAIAVIALMTLTAGTAVAASMKAKNIEAVGGVGEVGLDLGGTVDSKFKIKDGVIKSVKIKTVGEGFGGLIGAVINCEEKGSHSAGACTKAGDILNGAGVLSTHTSTAKLKVISHTPGALVGTLKGKLKADLTIAGANGEVLTGTAQLKIRSTDIPSVYSCLLGIDLDLLPAIVPVFGLIQTCVDSPGPNALGIYHVLSGTYPLDPAAGPVLVPVVLHVVDTGKFKVESDETEMKGKISVTVNSVGGVTTGPILITKTKAEFGDDD